MLNKNTTGWAAIVLCGIISIPDSNSDGELAIHGHEICLLGTDFGPEQNRERISFAVQQIKSHPNANIFLLPEAFIRTPIKNYTVAQDSRVKRLQLALKRQQLLFCGANTATANGVAGCVLQVDADTVLVCYSKRHPVPHEEVAAGSFSDLAAICVRRLQLRPQENINFSNDLNACLMLCYDASFPSMPNPKSRYLVQLSEEQFFHGTFGQYLYTWHSAARAAETGLPLIRCSNRGFSGLIFPNGRFHHSGTSTILPPRAFEFH